jgi:hypothetical protein
MRIITLSLLAVIFLGGCGKAKQVHEDIESGNVEVFGQKVSSSPSAGFSDMKLRERTLLKPEAEQRSSMPIHDPKKARPMTIFQ